MKRSILYLTILIITSTVTFAGRTPRPVELTIYSSKATEAAKLYRLLPRAEELTDGDAVPLYEKTIQSMPSDLDMKTIGEWRKTPLDELPREQIKATLDKCKPTMELIERAAKCRQCNWPEVDVEEGMTDLSKYRNILFIRDVQARLQIADGRYDEFIVTLQTNLALAKHLAESPVLVQGLVGISVAAVTLGRINEFVQVRDGPNLYWALQALPQPLIDLSDQTVLESPEIRGRITSMTNRVSRDLVGLQCIEAIRLYAGVHDGKFPDKLSDIAEFAVPNDPVAGESFSYSRTGSKAVLQAEATEDSEGRDAIRYELNLIEK